MAEKNKIEAQIASAKKRITNDNFEIFYQECCNLLDHIGEGYRENTYCDDGKRDAPHYRSEIPGINKIYLSYSMTNEDNDHNFIVEILSPIGEHLHRKIEIRGEIYGVKFYKSDDYTSEVDY